MQKPESEDLPAINGLHQVTNDGRCMIRFPLGNFCRTPVCTQTGFLYVQPFAESNKKDKTVKAQFKKEEESYE